MTLATTIRCETCKKIIREARPNQRFDSDACRKTAQRKRRAEQKGLPEVPKIESTIDGFATLTTRLRQKLRAGGDVAQRDLSRAVDLLVTEMESSRLTRRAKLEANVDRQTATVSQYISDLDNVASSMSEKNRAAANRRLDEALRDMRGDGVGGDDSVERFDSALLKNYQTFVEIEERQLFIARCKELFGATGWDYDQTPLIANFVMEENDAREALSRAIDGTSNSFALKSQALRRRKLERALGLDADTSDRLEGHVSPEAGLLKALVAELQRTPEQLEQEQAEEQRTHAEMRSRIETSNFWREAPELEQTETRPDVPALRDVMRDADLPF